MAINVVLDEPRKAARSTGANRDFRGIKGKRLRAQLGVFSQLQPTLDNYGVSAFVHFGEQVCP